MLSSEYFNQLYEYNHWANTRMIEVASDLASEKLFRVHGHSWGSVHGVLVHMLSAEWIWLSRWQGTSPSTMLQPEDFPTVQDIHQRWNQVDGELRAFVAAQTPQSLDQEITYSNTRGKRFTLKLWQMMAHLANHGTHHRGELAAMFAVMSVPHPEDEWLLFHLIRSGQVKD